MLYECFANGSNNFKKIAVSYYEPLSRNQRLNAAQVREVLSFATIKVVDIVTGSQIADADIKGIIASYLRSPSKFVGIEGTNRILSHQVEADNLQAVLVGAAFPDDVLASYLQEIEQLRKHEQGFSARLATLSDLTG